MARRFHFRRGKRKGPQALETSDYLSTARLSLKRDSWISWLKLPRFSFPWKGSGSENQGLKRFNLVTIARIIGHIIVLVRNMAVWAGFALLSVCLFLTITTAQAPWDILFGRPPQAQRTALMLWGNEQQQYGPDHIVSVGDDRSLLAMQLSHTTGNTLRIDSNGDVSKSDSVLFKDYTVYLWCDSRSSLWLHRGNKLLQKFGSGGEQLWQKQFELWPEAAWCSTDGYSLVLLIEGDLQQKLILYSPGGHEMWQYNMQNAILLDAEVGRQGRGVVLTVLSLVSAVPQGYGYLLDQNGNLTAVAPLGDTVPRLSAINGDGSVAAVGSNRSVVLMREGNDRPNLIIETRNELQALSLDESGRILACAMSLEQGFMLEGNRSEVQIYVVAPAEDSAEEVLERRWTYQLREALIALNIAGNPPMIYLTSSSWLRVFSMQAAAEWSIEERDLGAAIKQVVLAPSGEILGLLDIKDRMSVWRAPQQ